MEKQIGSHRNMAVLTWRNQPLSSFALLSSAFTDQLLERMGFSFAGYSMVDLAFLEEGGEEPLSANRQAPTIRLDLQLILKALRAGETKQERAQEKKLLERVLQLQTLRQTTIQPKLAFSQNYELHLQQSFPLVHSADEARRPTAAKRLQTMSKWEPNSCPAAVVVSDWLERPGSSSAAQPGKPAGTAPKGQSSQGRGGLGQRTVGPVLLTQTTNPQPQALAAAAPADPTGSAWLKDGSSAFAGEQTRDKTRGTDFSRPAFAKQAQRPLELTFQTPLGFQPDTETMGAVAFKHAVTSAMQKQLHQEQLARAQSPMTTAPALRVFSGTSKTSGGAALHTSELSDAAAAKDHGGSSRGADSARSLHAPQVLPHATDAASGLQGPGGHLAAGSPKARPTQGRLAGQTAVPQADSGRGPGVQLAAQNRDTTANASTLPVLSHGTTANPAILTALSHGTTANPSALSALDNGTTANPATLAALSHGTTANPATRPTLSHSTTSVPTTLPALNYGTMANPSVLPALNYGTASVPTTLPALSYGTTANPSALSALSHGTTANASTLAALIHGTTANASTLPALSYGTASVPATLATLSYGTTANPATLAALSHGTTANPATLAALSHGTTANASTLPALSYGTVSAPAALSVLNHSMTASYPGTVAILNPGMTASSGTVARFGHSTAASGGGMTGGKGTQDASGTLSGMALSSGDGIPQTVSQGARPVTTTAAKLPAMPAGKSPMSATDAGTAAQGRPAETWLQQASQAGSALPSRTSEGWGAPLVLTHGQKEQQDTQAGSPSPLPAHGQTGQTPPSAGTQQTFSERNKALETAATRTLEQQASRQKTGDMQREDSSSGFAQRKERQSAAGGLGEPPAFAGQREAALSARLPQEARPGQSQKGSSASALQKPGLAADRPAGTAPAVENQTGRASKANLPEAEGPQAALSKMGLLPAEQGLNDWSRPLTLTYGQAEAEQSQAQTRSYGQKPPVPGGAEPLETAVTRALGRQLAKRTGKTAVMRDLVQLSGTGNPPYGETIPGAERTQAGLGAYTAKPGLAGQKPEASLAQPQQVSLPGVADLQYVAREQTGHSGPPVLLSGAADLQYVTSEQKENSPTPARPQIDTTASAGLHTDVGRAEPRRTANRQGERLPWATGSRFGTAAGQGETAPYARYEEQALVHWAASGAASGPAEDHKTSALVQGFRETLSAVDRKRQTDRTRFPGERNFTLLRPTKLQTQQMFRVSETTPIGLRTLSPKPISAKQNIGAAAIGSTKDPQGPTNTEAGRQTAVASMGGEVLQPPGQPEPLPLADSKQAMDQPKPVTLTRAEQVLDQPKPVTLTHAGQTVDQPNPVTLTHAEQAMDQLKPVTLTHAGQTVNQPKPVTLTHAEPAVDQPKPITLTHAEPAMDQLKPVTLTRAEQVLDQPKPVTLTHAEPAVDQPKPITLTHAEQAVEQPKPVTLTHAEPAVDQPKPITLTHAEQVLDQLKPVTLTHAGQTVDQPKPVTLTHAEPAVDQLKPITLTHAEQVLDQLKPVPLTYAERAREPFGQSSFAGAQAASMLSASAGSRNRFRQAQAAGATAAGVQSPGSTETAVQDDETQKALPKWAKDFLASGYEPAETVYAKAGVTEGELQQLGTDRTVDDSRNAQISAGHRLQNSMTEAVKSLSSQKQMVWTAPTQTASQAVMKPVDLSFQEKKAQGAQAQTELKMSDAELKRAADRIYQMIETRLKQERRRMGY